VAERGLTLRSRRSRALPASRRYMPPPSRLIDRRDGHANAVGIRCCGEFLQIVDYATRMSTGFAVNPARRPERIGEFERSRRT
jgi:hypothetical protein